MRRVPLPTLVQRQESTMLSTAHWFIAHATSAGFTSLMHLYGVPRSALHGGFFPRSGAWTVRPPLGRKTTGSQICFSVHDPKAPNCDPKRRTCNPKRRTCNPLVPIRNLDGAIGDLLLRDCDLRLADSDPPASDYNPARPLAK
jgi:hypothetical protein